MREYPPIPIHATEFLNGYGYEIPVTVHSWQWSTTFGTWSALVTFANGWVGYTYPKLWGLTQEEIEEIEKREVWQSNSEC